MNRAVAVGLALLFSLVSTFAQENGRWSWEALVGLGQRNFDTVRDGTTISRFDENDLQLGFGVNGFIYDPALARFSLGADLFVSQIDGGRTVDTNDLAIRGDLDLLPRGATPLRLYFKHQMYDYTEPGGEDPFTLLGIPDTSTRWGGHFRVQRGAFRGIQLGYDRTDYDFLDPEANPELQESAFLVWNRSGEQLAHRVRLEHQSRDYGTVDLGVEDLQLIVDETAYLGPNWRWELFGHGIQREVSLSGGRRIETDDYRLQNRLFNEIRDRDTLEIAYTLGRFETDAEAPTDSIGLSTFYRWRPARSWEIAPFVRAARQTDQARTLRTNRAGLSVTWRRLGELLESVVTTRASYGAIDTSGFTSTADESELAYAVMGSLAQGDEAKLRTELELEYVANEVRLTRDPILELPDLGLSAAGIGAEDFYRGRIGMRHAWDSSGISGWGEWSRRDTTDVVAVENYELDNISGTFQFHAATLNVQATGGETSIAGGVADGQTVQYVGAAASWRIARLVSLRASYRDDTREFALTPGIDGNRAEAGVTVRLGRLSFKADIFETNEQLAGDVERSNRGLSWSISSRFAGWLPIVTGTNGRGVIR